MPAPQYDMCLSGGDCGSRGSRVCRRSQRSPSWALRLQASLCSGSSEEAAEYGVSSGLPFASTHLGSGMDVGFVTNRCFALLVHMVLVR